MKIVAPAGSIERFYAAIKGGAEEIYMGLKGFGARRNAVNLTVSEYKEALDYAHLRGVKVFLTLNTIMMDVEIEAIYHNLKELYKHGLDAVIVQDFGLAKFIKENFDGLELHGSTQMTVANHIEANYLKSLGFERVVLPRELSFEEIKEIRENTDIELEIFVSGALCISYSGNCYMSSFIGGRSGNRGMCAQPCRKKYTSCDEDKGYFLSPKDQMLGFEEIQKLKEIGIDSIKLEGRMKEPNYVYQTVSYYKNIINGINVDEKSSHIFNRGYSDGYFYKSDKEKIMNKDYASHIGKELGILTGNELKLSEKVVLGDGLIYLSGNYEKLGGGYINKIDTRFEKGKKFADSGEKILLSGLPKGTKYIHKNYSKEISDLTESEIKKADKKQIILIEFMGEIEKNPKVKAYLYNGRKDKIEVEVYGDKSLEKAKNKGTDETIVKEKLLELGDTTFVGEVKNIILSEGVFIPHSLLKQLKREMVDKLSKKLVESYRREHEIEIKKVERKENSSKKIILSAIVQNERQENILKDLGIEKIYKKNLDVAREGALNKIDLENKMGNNLYQILENKNAQVISGWNMNISNRYAFEQLSKIEKLDTIIVSPEISYRRLEEIGETKIKKAILGYGKLRGMYIELPLTKDEISIENEQGDKFTVIKNSFGNSEIYLEKPLNIFKDIKYLEQIGISEFVMEFTNETEEEIKDIIKGNGEYRAYNYEKGVF